VLFLSVNLYKASVVFSHIHFPFSQIMNYHRLILLLLLIFFLSINTKSQTTKTYQFGGFVFGSLTSTNHPYDGSTLYGTAYITCNGGKMIWSNMKPDQINTQHFFSKNFELYSGVIFFSRYLFYNSNVENIRIGELKVFPYLRMNFPYNFFSYISGGYNSMLWRAWESPPSSSSFYNPKLFRIGVGYEIGCGYSIPVFSIVRLEPAFAYNQNNLFQKLGSELKFYEVLNNIYFNITIQVYLRK